MLPRSEVAERNELPGTRRRVSMRQTRLPASTVRTNAVHLAYFAQVEQSTRQLNNTAKFTVGAFWIASNSAQRLGEETQPLCLRVTSRSHFEVIFSRSGRRL